MLSMGKKVRKSTMTALPLTTLLATMVLPGLAAAAPPALPPGLEATEGAVDSRTNFSATAEDASVWPQWSELTGFGELRAGDYLSSFADHNDFSLGEARLQLSSNALMGPVEFALTADFLADAVADDHEIHLNQGDGWLDLREAFFRLRPADNVDAKLGRQILTWGTGDLLFINDLFPKDWNAFILGRADDYLKAPSDAAKFSFFSERINLDVVYTPVFDSDRYVDGTRVSYYDASSGQISGKSRPVTTDQPDSFPDDGELALRLYRVIGTAEVAFYAYDGFWKSPAGFDPASGLATFPALRVLGASVRLPLGPGLCNAETGFYDSRDDEAGSDPFIKNSEWRFLLGYEQELAPELTGSVQYYLESLQDYSAYLATLLDSAYRQDQQRHVLSLRLTQQLLQQRLLLSFFNFWSPSDEDGHVRLKATYAWDDHWTTEAGANLFYADQSQTFFGQLKENNNLFVALRYGF